MKTTIKTILLTCLALLKFSLVQCQLNTNDKVGLSKNSISEIDYYLNQLGIKSNCNSISISIYHKDRVVYDSTIVNEGAGFVETDKNIFRIGSVSKVLTAGIILNMAKNGLLGLQNSVNQYISTNYPDDLTLKSLGSHTSGIRHYLYQEEAQRKKNYDNAYDALELFLNDSLLFQPNTDYQYTSYGTNLLGAIAERIYSKPFPDIVNHFFRTLQLSDTHVEEHHTFSPLYTELYDIDQRIESPKDISYKWPGAGFRSSTSDLVKFGSLFFTNSKFFPDELLEEVYRPTELETGEKIDCGFGWKIDFLSTGGFAIYHDGEIEGGHCHLLVLPEQMISIAIAINRGGNFSITEGLEIADIIIPLENKRVAIKEAQRQKQIRKILASLRKSIAQLRNALVEGALSKNTDLVDNSFQSGTWKNKDSLLKDLNSNPLVETSTNLDVQIKGIKNGSLTYIDGLNYSKILNQPTFIFILRKDGWKLFSIDFQQ